MNKSINDLTPEMIEGLAILAEECGEVVQMIGKILRHGLMNAHPDGVTGINKDRLESELGDILAAITLLHGLNVLDLPKISGLTLLKLKNIQKHLHHIQIVTD